MMTRMDSTSHSLPLSIPPPTPPLLLSEFRCCVENHFRHFSHRYMYLCFRQPYCVFEGTDFHLIELGQWKCVVMLPNILLEVCTLC